MVPFSGIELREAALAHVVLPNHRIANNTDGPWKRAAHVGLFSEKHVPLPHPSGTPVPEFRVTGVDDALEGSFKLHELIDFVVRRMLTRDASIQPAGRNDWIPINQIAILDICLRGELSRHPAFVTPPPVEPAAQRYVHDRRWKHTQTTNRQAETLPSEPNVASEDEALPITSNANHVDLVADSEQGTDATTSDHREQVRKNIRERIAKQGRPKLNIAYAAGLVVPVLGGVLLWWILQLPSSRTNRTDVIGSWVQVPSQKTGKAYGISFREDGTCVVFNSDGDCWSGDYRWADHTSREAAAPDLMRGKATGIAQNHHRDLVAASDGYVRLQVGNSQKPPMLGDKPIGELFLRRDDAFLWIGYLTDSSGGNASLDAGWVQLWPRNRAAKFGPIDDDTRGADLLARYGVPDEARPLQPTEITANLDPKSAEPRSFVRYGKERLTLFADGTVRRYRGP